MDVPAEHGRRLGQGVDEAGLHDGDGLQGDADLARLPPVKQRIL